MNSAENVPDHIRAILAKCEPIETEAENQLIRQARAGDKDARDRVVMANYRYIAYYIMRYLNVPNCLSFEDILNTGVAGLLKALDTYDCSRNCKFITYAHWWIRKEIVAEIYRNLSILRVPATKLKALEAVDKIREQKQNEVAELGGSDLLTIMGVAEGIISGAEGGDKNFETLMAAKNAMNVTFECSGDEKACSIDSVESCCIDHDSLYPGYVDSNASFRRDEERTDALIDATKAFEYVEGREEDIIRRHFGIDCPPQTFKEIAAFHAVSAERIRQIIYESLQKIRTAWGGD